VDDIFQKRCVFSEFAFRCIHRLSRSVVVPSRPASLRITDDSPVRALSSWRVVLHAYREYYNPIRQLVLAAANTKSSNSKYDFPPLRRPLVVSIDREGRQKSGSDKFGIMYIVYIRAIIRAVELHAVRRISTYCTYELQYSFHVLHYISGFL
jgi:hypothetical protein